MLLKNHNKREENLLEIIRNSKGSTDRFLLWADNQNIQKICPGRNDWTQLLRRRIHGINHVIPMPLEDHSLLFERFDGSRVFVSQPYQTIEDINESKVLLDWANKRGLAITLISDEMSWHYPGRTVLFQIEIENEPEYLNYIKVNRERINSNFTFIQ